MRRTLVLAAVICCLIAIVPARPHGQRPPTLSADLSGAPGDRIRVIVQPADDGNVSSLRGHLRGIVRRELQGAVALELTRAELNAMTRDSAFAHISTDAPV